MQSRILHKFFNSVHYLYFVLLIEVYLILIFFKEVVIDYFKLKELINIIEIKVSDIYKLIIVSNISK